MDKSIYFRHYLEAWLHMRRIGEQGAPWRIRAGVVGYVWAAPRGTT